MSEKTYHVHNILNLDDEYKQALDELKSAIASEARRGNNMDDVISTVCKVIEVKRKRLQAFDEYYDWWIKERS